MTVATINYGGLIADFPIDSPSSRRACSNDYYRLNNWQREYGADAIDTYCVSMIEKSGYVLEVLFLADQTDTV